jgi:hypothetical protein
MAFALWLEGDLAWAEGAHEYRAMGMAVIAASDSFRPRDFRRARKSLTRNAVSFAGLFASLEDVNRYLAERRARADIRPRKTPHSQHPKEYFRVRELI